MRNGSSMPNLARSTTRTSGRTIFSPLVANGSPSSNSATCTMNVATTMAIATWTSLRTVKASKSSPSRQALGAYHLTDGGVVAGGLVAGARDGLQRRALLDAQRSLRLGQLLELPAP